MKINFIMIMAFVVMIFQIPEAEAKTHYSGSHHTASHGGHYSGSHSSSHKGGKYKNTRTGNHYGCHKC